jgi:hypothetical protein
MERLEAEVAAWNGTNALHTPVKYRDFKEVLVTVTPAYVARGDTAVVEIFRKPGLRIIAGLDEVVPI